MAHNYQNVSSFRHSPDYKYIDLAVRSFQDQSVTSNQQLQFQETRDSPIVNSAADYKLSVVRFEIDTYNLPLLNFQVQRNQNDANKGAYAVSLEYDDGLGGALPSSGAVHLQWSAQSPNEPVPSPPDQNEYGLQEFTPYYWCTSYQYFINLINTALDTAMQGLIFFVPALAGVEPPFLSWNADSLSATIYARESHFDSDVFPRVNIYFNRPLYSLLSTFSFINFETPQTFSQQHRLLMRRFNGANVTVLPDFGVDNLIWSKQELSTIANMSPISSIVFTSSTLPIVPNDLSQISVIIDGEVLNLGNTYNNSENIITDLSTNEDGYRPNLIYTPSAEYRYVSLLDNKIPIKSIDISVFFRDYTGRLRPLILPGGASASVKVLFKKLTADEKASTHN